MFVAKPGIGLKVYGTNGLIGFSKVQQVIYGLKIGEDQAVQMPMKTVISLIVIVALGTMGYFQIVERLNVADTKIQLMQKDLEENTEFRIKYPRGELGQSLLADSRAFYDCRTSL